MIEWKKKIVIPMTAAAILAGTVIPASANEVTTPIVEDQEQEAEYVEKIVKYKGVDLSLVGTEEEMQEGHPVYEEQLETMKTVYDMQKEDSRAEKRQNPEKDVEILVVPDQYSQHRITNYYYNTFYTSNTWTNVKYVLMLAVGGLASQISMSVSPDSRSQAAVAVMGSVAATFVTDNYVTDYTKTYYIKSWSSYYGMYTYRVVTNIYSDSSRADWSLKSVKVSGLLKKSGSYFYAL